MNVKKKSYWTLDMSNVIMDIDVTGAVDETSVDGNGHNMTTLHLNRTFDDNNATDYEYDYESSNTVFLEDVIPMSIIYGLTLVIGILGNTLIILTISRYRRMRTITNVFLASLASADLLLILICVPVMVRRCFIFIFFLCLKRIYQS